MTSSPEIVRDICRKCGEDVASAISRNMALVSGGEEMSRVALMGAVAAMGAAGGAFVAMAAQVSTDPMSDEEVADALFAMLRPMVVRSVGKLRERNAGA